MSFGKSKAKMLTRGEDLVNFKKCCGCDEAKEEVSEVVDFLKDPKNFQKIGGRIPKGVLMVGPPGTGKNPTCQSCRGRSGGALLSDQVVLTLWRCLLELALRECAICLSKDVKMHSVSFLLMKLTL